MLKHASTINGGAERQHLPLNGQIRTNSNIISGSGASVSPANVITSLSTTSITCTATTTSTAAITPPTITTTTAAVAVAGAAITTGGGTLLTPRNIHLRPQQPLNISTLSAITATPAPQITPAVATTTTTITTTQLTPNGINGNCISANINNNLHTYTNQQMLAATAAAAAKASAATSKPSPPALTSSVIPNVNPSITHAPAPPINHKYLHNTSNFNNKMNTTLLTANHTTNAQQPPQQNNNHNTHNHNYSNSINLTTATSNPAGVLNKSRHGPGPREALTSLGLLCLVSLLLALLSLIFLLKISPNGRDEGGVSRNHPIEDFVIVYDVTLGLCALSLSLNLCCLLVCAIQFLFAVKLLRSPMFDGRDNQYLEKSSVSRTCAVGGFFVSIPTFLTGIILYTFNHFHSTPAIITSVLIGIGIIFCGVAMVHNVFVWQKEKTISYRSPPFNMSMISHVGPIQPPPQFLNSTAHSANLLNSSNNFYGAMPQSSQPTSHNSILYYPTNNLYQQHQQQLQQQQQQTIQNHIHRPISVTPVSPNHSQGSFNPLVSLQAGGALNSSFIMRPSTATPPTPKILANGCLTHSPAVIPTGIVGREASGSISPCLNATLDMSNITSPSLHELSTLV